MGAQANDIRTQPFRHLTNRLRDRTVFDHLPLRDDAVRCRLRRYQRTKFLGARLDVFGVSRLEPTVGRTLQMFAAGEFLGMHHMLTCRTP